MQFCRLCSVKTECDDYATRKKINVGVWGGKRRTRDLENGA
jgi:hypothetical protein